MKYNLFTILLFICADVISQSTAFSELKPGPYPVGYRVVNQYDYGRSVLPKKDFEGNLNKQETAMPVQISIWYPAVKSGSKKMLFEEYLFITEQKNNFRPLTKKQKDDLRGNVKFTVLFGTGIEIKDEQINQICKKPTLAVKDAIPATGSFPVIISGTDGGPANINVMAEYLASIGYIILSTPSIERTGTLQATNAGLALDDRIGNLEYLMAYRRKLPNIDLTRTGVLGVNFDGMAALLFQMKHMQTEAVVSIDGWEGKKGPENTLINSPFFDVNKMRAPYFVVLQDENEPPSFLKLSTRVADTLSYADRYYYVFNGINHMCLVGNIAVFPDLSAEKKQALYFLFSSIGNFFDGYLKNSQKAKSFLKATPKQNDLPDSIIKTNFNKDGLAAVPVGKEFENLIMTGQLDKALDIVKKGRQANPAMILFSESDMDLYAFRFTRQKKIEHVLGIRLIATEGRPGSAIAMEKLGDVYILMGKKTEAKKCFEKGVELLTNDSLIDEPAKKDIEKRLENKIQQMQSDNVKMKM